MGIWLELGLFIVVLAWGFWQLHDVKKAIRERERAQNLPDARTHPPSPRADDPAA